MSAPPRRVVRARTLRTVTAAALLSCLVVLVLAGMRIYLAPSPRFRTSIHAGVWAIQWLPSSTPVTLPPTASASAMESWNAPLPPNFALGAGPSGTWPDGRQPMKFGTGVLIDRGAYFRGWIWHPILRLQGPARMIVVPLWISFVLGAVVGGLGLVQLRRQRVPAGHCRNCGYDLTGNASGVCSECGEPSD